MAQMCSGKHLKEHRRSTAIEVLTTVLWQELQVMIVDDACPFYATLPHRSWIHMRLADLQASVSQVRKFPRTLQKIMWVTARRVSRIGSPLGCCSAG